MQETRHILQFSEISGERRNPSTTEDGKFPRYNNTSGKFDYTCIGDGGDSDINISYFTDLITNIIESADTNTYLNAISRYGNYGKFTMSSGTNLYLALGALAWEDSVEADLTLPGNTKVLYDNNDEIGGSAKFTYNYTLNRLQLDSAPIMFKTGAETYKEGIDYLGNYSFRVGSSALSTGGGSYNFTGGYKAGQSLNTDSLRNLVLGAYAGEVAGSDIKNSIFIGSYAGRYENTSNKFFLDNKDHGDTVTAQSDSFLYAELGTERRLYIRDRLSVEKEGKFGTSGLLDAEGEYGMYQMSAETGGNPQWHDGTVWQDFANSIDTYLDDVTYSEGTLTFTLSDASTIGPIDISDINTTLFATSPSSPSTGQTGTSDYGYIQISNGSFTNNEGLTYKTGFRVNGSELLIPGSINLSSYTSSTDNSIWTDGTHGYINLGGTAYQIDNDVLDAYYGVNIGGGTYEVFKQINADNEFEYRTFRSTPIGSDNPNDRIKFSHSSDGDVIFIGTTAERNRLDTVVDSAFSDVAIDRDNSGETLLMRALRPGSGVTLTQNEEYIQIDAVTSGGGGEVNTMTNLGTGEGVYYQKNGVQFELKSLTAADDRLAYTATTSEIDLALSLTPSSSNLTNSTSKTYSGSVNGSWLNPTSTTPTIQFKKIISNSIAITENADELILEASSGTASNIGGGDLEIYNTGSSLPFEFRTISNTGDHLYIRYVGDTIKFSVDDIQLTNLGTGIYPITPESNGFNFTQKAFTEGYAISLDNATDTDLIEIGVSELIPQFSFVTTPVYTSGLLEFKANYSNDIVNTALAPTTLFQINIGDGLIYTPATNTLSTNSSGSTTVVDYALRDVSVSSDTITEKTYSLEVNDGLGNIENTFDIVIPKYELPNATYTSTGTLGGVTIKQNSFVWENDTQKYLTLDEVSGELDFPYEVVTYDTQNNLHDRDNAANINNKRRVARANIGAAYINGASTEDFRTKILTAKDKVYCDHLTSSAGLAEFGDDPSQLEAIIFRGAHITSTKINDSIYISKRNAQDTSPTAVGVGTGYLVFQTNVDQGSGLVSIYKTTNAGVNEKMFSFDVNTGDLYVKGSIRAGGTIEAFDDDAANI